MKRLGILLITQGSIYKYFCIVIWEDEMAAMFRKYRDGSFFFVYDIEGVPELYEGFIH